MPDYYIFKPCKSFPLSFSMQDWEDVQRTRHRQNMEKYAGILKRYQVVLAEVKDIFGAQSNVYKYMRSHSPAKPTGPDSAIKRTKKLYRAALKKRSDRQKAKEYRAKRQHRLEKLLEKGLEPDVDFPANRVVSWWNKNIVEHDGEIFLVEEGEIV